MESSQKAVILTELIDTLRRNGSWCGETHVQKAVYFLQKLLGVDTGFEYILYKHGPYSFDLAEELTSLRADYLVEFDYRSPGYGPSFAPTKTSADLRANFPKTLSAHSSRIQFIAKAFGPKGVQDLEKLATALWVTEELGESSDVAARAQRIHALKPHVRVDDAHSAIQQFERIATQAKSLELNAG